MPLTKPRVLILIKGLGIGGAEKLISEGARYWDRDRFDYSVAYVLPWKDQLVGEIERLGIDVELIGSDRGSPRPSCLDCVTSYGGEASIWSMPTYPLWGSWPGSPRPSRSYIPSTTWPSRIGPYRWANRLTYGRNRAVMAVSGAVAASVSSWPGRPVTVIPNGVAVHAGAAEARTAREKLGLSDDAPLVTHVGNIRPGKGHDVLIDAAAILVKTMPDVTIVSIGGEKYPGDLDRVQTRVAEEGVGQSFASWEDDPTHFPSSPPLMSLSTRPRWKGSRSRSSRLWRWAGR